MADVKHQLDGLSVEEKRRLLARLLAQRATQPVDYPLSGMQQPLWLYEQLEPGTSIYNNPLRLRIRGPLDRGRLERAIAAVVARHDALRTAFVERDGQPIQRVSPTVAVALPVTDLSPKPAEERARALRELEASVARRPFDLANPPLVRFVLVRLTDAEHVLLVVSHQLVCDGWSIAVLLNEMTAAYGGADSGAALLPPLPIQYPDLVARQLREGALASDQSLTFWKQHLAGCPPESEWPTDRVRSAAHTHRGAAASRWLSADLNARLAALGRAEGATLFMTLLAALKLLLFLHTGQEDLVIGVPVAGREDRDAAPLIGCFVNTVAIRSTVAGALTFADLVGRVRTASLDAYRHQRTPFPDVLDAAGVARDPARSPLFQIFFNVLNLPNRPLDAAGLSFVAESLPEMDAKFDLTFYVAEHGGRLLVDLVYNADLYGEATARDILAQYERVLEAVSRNPRLPICETPLGTPPVESCRSPIPPGPSFDPFEERAIDQSIGGRFATTAARFAAHEAVVGPSGAWTYRELDRRVTAIGRHLATVAGQGAGMVGVLCAQAPGAVAAILGTLVAGKSYVPLDPLTPIERLRFIVRDAGATAILTDASNRRTAEVLIEPSRVIDVDDAAAGAGSEPLIDLGHAAPDDLAYVLYTSGSTGTPKGVMQSHRNALHFARVYANNLRISSGDRLSLVPWYGFDAAIMDMLGALLNGATLVIRDVRQQGVTGLPAWIRANRISIYHSTPTVFRLAFAGECAEDLASVRAAVLGGEEATVSDLALFRRRFPPAAWLVNGFGPTEATVCLQAYYSAGAEWHRPSLPVGLPVDGIDVRLVHPEGGFSEVVGELQICSPYVALGYWQQPSLTARAFDRDDRGHSAYRTGDIMRRLSDGTFEFLGRRDGQVKLRGMRVEIGEVEAVLAEHPAVAQAAVVAADGPAGAASGLTAFVTARSGRVVDERDVRRWLRERLPEYMLPAAIVNLRALPLTASGKVDRARLRETPVPASQHDVPPAPPQTDTERAVAAVWRDLLGADPISRDVDFFVVGGNSLHASQLISRLRVRFGVDVPLRSVFDNPNVAGLAAAVEAAARGGPAVEREEVEF